MEYEENAVLVEDGPTKAGGGGAPEAELQTNATSIWWGFKTILAQGQWQLNFFFGGSVIVRRDSQVAVSITEVDAQDTPFLGAANMWIMNVVPQDDGTITVRGHVAHPSRLRCQVNFVIVN